MREGPPAHAPRLAAAPATRLGGARRPPPTAHAATPHRRPQTHPPPRARDAHHLPWSEHWQMAADAPRPAAGGRRPSPPRRARRRRPPAAEAPAAAARAARHHPPPPRRRQRRRRGGAHGGSGPPAARVKPPPPPPAAVAAPTAVSGEGRVNLRGGSGSRRTASARPCGFPVARRHPRWPPTRHTHTHNSIPLSRKVRIFFAQKSIGSCPISKKRRKNPRTSVHPS